MHASSLLGCVAKLECTFPGHRWNCTLVNFKCKWNDTSLGRRYRHTFIPFLLFCLPLIYVI